MNDKTDLICKDFENVKWLFDEGGLSIDKMKFWQAHIRECKTCANQLKRETKLLLELKEELSEDILDSKFDMMISKAVSQKKISLKHLISFNNVFEVKAKVALISGLAVVAILISLIIPRQNPVKTISSELLDWEGENIKVQINHIEQKIETINSDNWSKEINSIDDQLQRIEVNIDKF